jgi:hypothetical protein
LVHIRQQVKIFVDKYEDYKAKGLSSEVQPPYLLEPFLPEAYKGQLTPPKSTEDLQPDYCVLLTLIHDNMLPSPQFVPINDGIYEAGGEVARLCAEHYLGRGEGQDTRALIETALQSVKDRIGNPIDSLDHPIRCADVRLEVRDLSHNIARKLRSCGFPVVKSGGRNYCQLKDVLVLYPRQRSRLLRKFEGNGEDSDE